MTRYLVVIESQGPPSEEGGYPFSTERVFEAHQETPEEAATFILNPLHLEQGWSVQRVRVYELAGEEPPLAVMVAPAPQWVLRG